MDLESTKQCCFFTLAESTAFFGALEDCGFPVRALNEHFGPGQEEAEQLDLPLPTQLRRWAHCVDPSDLQDPVSWPTSKRVLADYLRSLNVNEPEAAAADLLREFGSVSELMAGSWWRLRRAVGRPVATTILSARALMNAVLQDRLEARPLVSSRKDLLEFLHFNLGLNERESMWAIYLDADNRLIRIEPIARGSIMELTIDKSRIIQIGLNLGAVGVILVHNHPSGDPTPSSRDRQFTKALRRLMEELDLILVDHLIVARNGVRSVCLNRFDDR